MVLPLNLRSDLLDMTWKAERHPAKFPVLKDTDSPKPNKKTASSNAIASDEAAFYLWASEQMVSTISKSSAKRTHLLFYNSLFLIA